MNDSIRAGVLQETFGGQWALADVVARLRVARMAWRKRQGRSREHRLAEAPPGQCALGGGARQQVAGAGQRDVQGHPRVAVGGVMPIDT